MKETFRINVIYQCTDEDENGDPIIREEAREEEWEVTKIYGKSRDAFMEKMDGISLYHADEGTGDDTERYWVIFGVGFPRTGEELEKIINNAEDGEICDGYSCDLIEVED